ncbi:hypothetical protein LIER_36782 [Lithospermum erythrorhizon]|uniref:Uncharacterized protein n=1 Tax=Lithospermum erythrorhizon TaxID=34254 RepID=A0AAV3PBN4_LITER
MLPEYGSARSTAYRPSVVHQMIPPVDHNAAILQELLANQKRESAGVRVFGFGAAFFLGSKCFFFFGGGAKETGMLSATLFRRGLIVGIAATEGVVGAKKAGTIES